MNDTAYWDKLIQRFLPQNISGNLYQHISHQNMDEWAKIILGTDEMEHIPDRVAKALGAIEDKESAAKLKENEFQDIYFRYSRIFNLCRVIGAVNLYDIGCQTVNQSFLLADDTKMSYTGITNSCFDLIDFLYTDIAEGNYNIIMTNQVPQSLYGGRISFIKGHYPDFPLEVKQNNIGIAYDSLTMCRTEERVTQAVAALSRDFERILLNINVFIPERMEFWKIQNWSAFDIYSIGERGFVFGTKNSEDIRRLKEMYPFEDGRFITGIDRNYCQ